MHISSPKNTQIKNLVKLQQKSRWRKECNEFLVEGIQENKLALENAYENVAFFICEDLYHQQLDLKGYHTNTIDKEVFEKIAYRKTTGGILGVYKTKKFTLGSIVSKTPVVVVLEQVEKPGNLGAILRTCDAVNADAVIICDERVDFFNPNVIRSSVGTVFTNQLIYSSKENVVEWAERNKIPLFATYLREDTLSLFEVNLKNGAVWVFGTEADGLSSFWLNQVTSTVKIPMLGQVDSLNVSNAVAVCLYESLRQQIQSLKKA